MGNLKMVSDFEKPDSLKTKLVPTLLLSLEKPEDLVTVVPNSCMELSSSYSLQLGLATLLPCYLHLDHLPGHLSVWLWEPYNREVRHRKGQVPMAQPHSIPPPSQGCLLWYSSSTMMCASDFCPTWVYFICLTAHPRREEVLMARTFQGTKEKQMIPLQGEVLSWIWKWWWKQAHEPLLLWKSPVWAKNIGQRARTIGCI